MASKRVIEVELPEGAEPTPEELEMLETTVQALVSLRREGRGELEQALQQLEADGWSVHCRLGWIAEARRGRDFEQAFGVTRDRAVAELHTLTALDTLAGYSA
jgi:hypothetical protein